MGSCEALWNVSCRVSGELTIEVLRLRRFRGCSALSCEVEISLISSEFDDVLLLRWGLGVQEQDLVQDN